MDPVSKLETALVIAKAFKDVTSDQMTRIVNLSNAIQGLTDDEIAALVTQSKTMNASFPEGTTISERRQVQRSVIDVNLDPATSASLARRLGTAG